MKTRSFWKLGITLGLLGGLLAESWAEDRRFFGGRRQKEDAPISAFTGLEKMKSTFGIEAAETIVEMRGLQGQSQPISWELVVFDRQSPLFVREFTLTEKHSLEKEAQPKYPNQVPTGFIDKQKLLIDSTASFRILELEAKRAGVSFNHVNYQLTCQEFTRDPLWRLTAIDVDGYVAGRVDLSGSTGTVLRTVWYSWNRGSRGYPLVVDSAAPEDYTAPPALPFPTDVPNPQVTLEPVNPQTEMPIVGAGVTAGVVPLVTPPGAPVVEVSPVEPARSLTPVNPSPQPGTLAPPTPNPGGTPGAVVSPAAPIAPGAPMVVPQVPVRPEGDPVRVEPIPVEPAPIVEVEPASF
tara:strand:+ start:25304 stop:26356 length:1053 start_codon:yes stop_codon:yes gene_type:complete